MEYDGPEPLFAQEREVYNNLLPDLLVSDLGRFALIKDDQFHGTYNTENDATDIGYRTFGNVAFLVKEIIEIEPIQTVNQSRIGHRKLRIRRFIHNAGNIAASGGYSLITPKSDQ